MANHNPDRPAVRHPHRNGLGEGWNDYAPATLSQITKKHTSHFSNRKVPKGVVAINLHPAGDPLRSTVLFLGKVRNIKPGRRSLIEMWGKSSGMDTAMLAKTYKKEIKVREHSQTSKRPAGGRASLSAAPYSRASCSLRLLPPYVRYKLSRLL